MKVEKLEIPRVFIDIRRITVHKPLYYWGRLVLIITSKPTANLKTKPVDQAKHGCPQW